MRKAFTLIELLVVISIIALLIAILLPALSQARASGRLAQCLSNTRQLGTAIYTYAVDNKEELPKYLQREDVVWTQTLVDYVGGNEWRQSGQTLIDGEVYLCPDSQVDGELLPSATNVQGDPDKAWVFRGAVRARGSYTMNGYLFTTRYESQYPSIAWPRTDNRYYNENGFPDILSNIRLPSERPIFTDGNWIDGWPDEDDPRPPAGDFGNFTTANVGGHGMLGRFLTNFHGNKTNVSFMDGHGETIETRQLWDLKWVPTWKDGI